MYLVIYSSKQWEQEPLSKSKHQISLKSVTWERMRVTENSWCSQDWHCVRRRVQPQYSTHFVRHATYRKALAGKNIQNFLSPGGPAPNGPFSGSITFLALYQQIKASEQGFRIGPIIPALSLAFSSENLFPCCESQVSISPLLYRKNGKPFPQYLLAI